MHAAMAISQQLGALHIPNHHKYLPALACGCAGIVC